MSMHAHAAAWGGHWPGVGGGVRKSNEVPEHKSQEHKSQEPRKGDIVS
jgi:hypothetical protein